jgi:hypothetical protein
MGGIADWGIVGKGWPCARRASRCGSLVGSWVILIGFGRIVFRIGA